LKKAFELAVGEAHQRRLDAAIKIHDAAPGLYVQFESPPGVPLNIASLENRIQRIEVVAVTSRAGVDQDDGPPIEQATVFVPEGKVSHFLKRFEDYAKTTPKVKGERRHEDMLDRVADLQLATLRSLWTDATTAYPADDEKIWWEVWLRRHDGKELQRIIEFAGHQKLTISDRRLQFDGCRFESGQLKQPD